MSKKDLMPCPVCGADPETGKSGDKHVVFCNDHPFTGVSGKTEQEASVKWNTGSWGETMNKEVSDDDDESEI